MPLRMPRRRKATACRSSSRWSSGWLFLLLVSWLLWLLSEILLPFIAGPAIAYLLTPVTDRIERLGVNRLAAALLIITVVVMAFVWSSCWWRRSWAANCRPSSTMFPAT